MKKMMPLLILILIFGYSSAALAQVNPQAKSIEQQFGLFDCRDKVFKVEFLCNPEWELVSEKNALFMIISSSPAVTLTVVKTDSPYAYTGQITKSVLEEWHQYADGFQKEEVKISGENALMVKAFSKNYPDVRMLDYYVIHESSLYNVLFSVNPKTNWDDYKFLIKKIADSFKFVR